MPEELITEAEFLAAVKVVRLYHAQVKEISDSAIENRIIKGDLDPNSEMDYGGLHSNVVHAMRDIVYKRCPEYYMEGTVKQICDCLSVEELLKKLEIGAKRIEQIQTFFNRYGLRLREKQ